MYLAENESMAEKSKEKIKSNKREKVEHGLWR
jgi:hypothetical protein